MEFKLTPVSKLFYDNEVRISKKRRNTRNIKYDELEIEYYRRIGIDFKPKIREVK